MLKENSASQDRSLVVLVKSFSDYSWAVYYRMQNVFLVLLVLWSYMRRPSSGRWKHKCKLQTNFRFGGGRVLPFALEWKNKRNLYIERVFLLVSSLSMPLSTWIFSLIYITIRQFSFATTMPLLVFISVSFVFPKIRCSLVLNTFFIGGHF